MKNIYSDEKDLVILREALNYQIKRVNANMNAVEDIIEADDRGDIRDYYEDQKKRIENMMLEINVKRARSNFFKIKIPKRL